ncbi:MAG: hypothetical protein AAGF11_18030 [Myxococcota bacterium]
MNTNKVLHSLPLLLLTATAAASCKGPTGGDGGDDPPAVELVSAGALEFGPDGVLFVGDSYGAQLVAIETGDTEPPANPMSIAFVEELDVEIAALLGTDPRQIVINDMAVNPQSQNIYFSVHIGRSIDPQPALIRYDHDAGTLEPLDLAALDMTTVALPNAPAFEEALQYGQSMRTMTVTDLTYYNGEVLVAGVSNQEFSSTLRRVAYPFTDAMTVSSVEIFHAAHDQQETRAPIVTSMVQEIDGDPYLIAAYTCTPLARFPLNDLVDGAHVVGDTIAELGFGNAPVDMLVYQNPDFLGGDERLLVTNDQRSAVSVSTALLGDAPALTEAVLFDTEGLDQFVMPLSGALHTDALNEQLIVTVRRNVQTGDLHLMSMLTGFFFEVSESIAEYNFPGVDPSPMEQTNPIDYGFED